MSVKYTPVQWNHNKWLYDAVMLIGVVAFLSIFLFIIPDFLSHDFPINPQVHNARAFGACAFVMLTVILCIGPLARLDKRFLPLLYNRRHFGVMTVFVALTHASYILNWYFAFSKSDKYAALLFANTSYGQIAGFPFEVFGILALLCLLVLAATSHDFWMKFLTPPVWKRMHLLVYVAYTAVIAHVFLGVVQDQQNETVTTMFLGCGFLVAALHAAVALREWRDGDKHGAADAGWITVCDAQDIREALPGSPFCPTETVLRCSGRRAS